MHETAKNAAQLARQSDDPFRSRKVERYVPERLIDWNAHNEQRDGTSRSTAELLSGPAIELSIEPRPVRRSAHSRLMTAAGA